MTTSVEILEQAKALIDKPQKWCKGDLRSANGARHCALGAIDAIGYDWVGSPPLRALETARRTFDLKPSETSVSSFNDARTHAEVMELYDRAIEIAKKTENL